MKNVSALILFLTGTLLVSAQASLFNKFEDLNEVSSVVVTQEAFKLMKNMGGKTPEAKEYQDLINGLSELKVLTTVNTKIAADMQTTFNTYVNSGKLTELMRIKDKGSTVSFYIKKSAKEDIVYELVMFASNGNSAKKETVLMFLTGTIDLNKVYRLTEQMHIPGGEHLKNTKKQ
ncbi:MAG: DUF4252 domain-containing protein [Flavobacteriaceae bacterium]|nr:DUF4252 domain-containing protein [Flavobacteriaceae bacterium]